LDFYDIVYNDLKIDYDSFAKELGFKKILILGKDISFSEKFSDNVAIGISSDIKTLKQFVQHNVHAIVIKGSYIDKMLISMMHENNTILYLPLSDIMSAYNTERLKRIYYMKRLFEYTKSKKVNISFASFASNNLYLTSAMQLIELAKLIGADERYAKYSISTITKSLCDKYEK
jgi:RNase P/RNase MRP subunit p30